MGPECLRGQYVPVPSSFASIEFNYTTTTSPKPGLPPPGAYEPPPPPSTRELGPPPPGFARYADLDRGPGGLVVGPNAPAQNTQRRDPNEVTCFKVCPSEPI